MTGPAISAHGLRRSFQEQVAVDGIDLEVGSGESFALLGPNGAGKTTTIAMLTTLLRPDGGSATVAGCDVVADRRGVRSRIGIVFQDPTLDIHLTVAENLRFHGALYDIPRREVAPRIAELLERLDLAARRDDLVRTLSGGLRRRLELARGIMHRPEVLFLDEPTLGLDPRARATFGELLDELHTELGTTTVLTTHYLTEAEGCDRVAIMDAGRIAACDAPGVLRAQLAPGATLEDVFLARTGRGLGDEDDRSVDRRDEGRTIDRQRSGPRT